MHYSGGWDLGGAGTAARGYEKGHATTRPSLPVSRRHKAHEGVTKQTPQLFYYIEYTKKHRHIIQIISLDRRPHCAGRDLVGRFAKCRLTYPGQPSTGTCELMVQSSYSFCTLVEVYSGVLLPIISQFILTESAIEKK